MGLRSRRATRTGRVRSAWIAGVIAIASLQVVAQQPPGPAWEKLEFDVASVKLNRSGTNDTNSNFPLGAGDVYIPNGGTFVATNFPLIVYINFAYRITSNPDWSPKFLCCNSNIFML